MISRIKLFGKNIFKGINAVTGVFLPVTNMRAGYGIPGVEIRELTKPVFIKGSIQTYRHNIETNPPYWIALFNSGIAIPSLFYVSLPNAVMVSRGVIIFQHRVLLESAIFQREYLNKLLANHKIIRFLFKQPKKKFGRVIPLLNKLSNNYFHWTTESLTRLALFAEYSGENYHDYDIIISADSPRFVQESLTALFNIRPEKIIRWGNDNTGSLEQCILISYPFIRTKETAMTNIYHFPSFRLLNTFSLKNIPAVSEAPEYLIVSRANVKQRKLAGEEKIVAAFPNIPFKIIHTEKMGFAEQVIAFRNARLIIAPHGAGLINLVYTTRKPVVIEIFPSTRKIRDASLFVQASRDTGIDYYLLVNEPFNNDQDINISDGLLAEINSIISAYQF